MYSYGPPHMAEQKQDDDLEHKYSSYVRIRDVSLKTCRRRWTIGRSGKRGSGISVLAARHDDDDIVDNDFYNLSEIISDILQWTPSDERVKASRPARTYIQQLCADKGYSLEDLSGAMDDKDGGRERVREIRASSVTWLWWWWWW